MDEPRRDKSLDDALYYAGGLLWEWGILENGLNGAIAALRRGDEKAAPRPPTDFDKPFANRRKEWRSLQVARHGEKSDQVRFVDRVIAAINKRIQHRHNIAHGIMGAISKPGQPTAIICTVDHYRGTLAEDPPKYEDYTAARLEREGEHIRNLANFVKLATYAKVERKPRKKGG
jgi:hypothetical protein